MAYDLRTLIKVALPEFTAEKYSIFTDRQLAEIQQLIKYADYYDNNAFKYIEEVYPEYSISENTDYRPAQVPLNYSKLIVDKLASWQFEENIDISVIAEKDNKTAKGQAKEAEDKLYEVNKANNAGLKWLQAAKECNIAGGVPIKLKYDEDMKQVRILPRNMIECFPVMEFDDYEKMIRVHFCAFRDEKTIWKQTYELKDIGKGKKGCWFSEKLYDATNLKVEKIVAEYFLGKGKKLLDFIPVYIIPNMPSIGEIRGTSELADLIPIIDEINRKYSDSSDALRFEMFAITILMNVKAFSSPGRPEDKVKRKPGAIWNVVGGPGDVKSDISKLESGFNYIDVLRYHLDSLKSLLFEFSGVIQLEAERLKSVGNLSGVALKLLFASIISKTTQKNTIWQPKLEQIYYDILKMKEVYEGYQIPEGIDIEIIMHTPVPQNELEEVQIAVQKISAGLSSVKREMSIAGVENPEELIIEIAKEQEAQQKAMGDIYNENG